MDRTEGDPGSDQDGSDIVCVDTIETAEPASAPTAGSEFGTRISDAGGVKSWYVVNFTGFNSTNIMGIAAKLQKFLGEENVFCPIVKERRFNGKRRIYYEVEIPLFFGYIFIKTCFDPRLPDELEDKIAPRGEFLKYGSGGSWASITDEEIDSLRSEHRQLINHEVVLDSTIAMGDIVRFKSGPFANFTGKIILVFPSKSTAKVSTMVFKSVISVECALSNLEQV